MSCVGVKPVVGLECEAPFVVKSLNISCVVGVKGFLNPSSSAVNSLDELGILRDGVVDIDVESLDLIFPILAGSDGVALLLSPAHADDNKC